MRTLLLSLILVFMPSMLFASADGIYGLIKNVNASWDGTDASLIAPTTPDYDYAYGDEAYLTYTLPQTWSFTFYGQPYTQITVDTNGNIWFGTTGSANSFSLPSNGKGPVIAAWNNDLSSYFAGGVFVQHKTDLPLGDRLVVEWQAESYTDEGLALPNNFEVVLFPNGDIRIDYKSFNVANAKDFGSGISSNDNTHYLSITSAFSSPVYQLFGNSYSFTTSRLPLHVNFVGIGGGSVTSTPAGIACNTNCTANFLTGEQITLHPSVDQYSTFTGWSNGTCSGLGDCLLTLLNEASVTAGFTRDTTRQVCLPGDNPLYFSTIQAAYDNASTGSAIQIWATDYTEVVNCNREIDVALQGGYDKDYANQVGTTVIQGELNILQGQVTVDGIAIR